MFSYPSRFPPKYPNQKKSSSVKCEKILNVLKEQQLYGKPSHSPNSLLSLSSFGHAFLFFSVHCLVFILLRAKFSALYSLPPLRSTHPSLPLRDAGPPFPGRPPAAALDLPARWVRGETPDGSATGYRSVLGSSCLHLSLLGLYHTQLPLQPAPIRLLLKCSQSLDQPVAAARCFSPRFLLTHQTGRLAIRLFQVRKDEIVTADGKT